VYYNSGHLYATMNSQMLGKQKRADTAERKTKKLNAFRFLLAMYTRSPEQAFYKTKTHRNLKSNKFGQYSMLYHLFPGGSWVHSSCLQ
jgi:hypothetical protein